ncbi:MAG: DUF4294 domain-containing protein [Chitinophagales bacterium]
MKYLILILISLNVIQINGQSNTMDTTRTTITMLDANGDTLRKTTQAVIVKDLRPKRTPLEEEAYQKLRRRVIKLYPYALLAKQIYEETNANLNSLESNSEKRKFKKQKEQELRDRFENEIKALYTTDGPVLVKLIHRETNKTTYDLLRESKSWFNCTLYQMAAKRNGYSLKDTYDPEIDKEIEGVVQILKSEGQLPLAPN